MIEIVDKANCCGCTACACICPKKCIEMIPDSLGFLYPKVDVSNCVKCGLCIKVCSFHPNYNIDDNFSNPIVYALRHNNEKELMKSQSGGAFVALSDYMLKLGGVIYGVGFDENFRVIHKRAETKKKRDEFRGSKYVQSDLRGILQQVSEDLRKGRKVLFSGTPCQTAGVYAYVKPKYRENLVLVDLVCHGVPSPFIWRDYLVYLEQIKHQKIQEIVFRDKYYGWNSSVSTFKFANKNKIKNTSFSYLFYKGVMQRESCAICPFTNLHRPSDITIGDFWGWTDKNNEFNDNKGVSLVLLNTPKGEKIFDKIQSSIFCIKSNLIDCLQPQLRYPAVLHPKRSSFEEEYTKKGFKYVAKKYGGIGWWHTCWNIKMYLIKCLAKFKSTLEK